MAAARFSPLALPTMLHDLPLNYAQRISLYDGEGNVTAKYHVGKFDDFIDLEEVDYHGCQDETVCIELVWGSQKLV